MLGANILRHLFNDDESLSNYLLDRSVSFNDVKRRVFLKERSENINVPDQYYRALQRKGFEDINTIDDLFTKGLYRISESFLELSSDRVSVVAVKQNEWQQMITYVPPLILQSAFLEIKSPLIGQDTVTINRYFREVLLPNTKHTALPSPYIKQLKGYVESQMGFCDLHMHLNGSTETDIAWQRHLATPKRVYRDFSMAFRDQMVKEQMEQESHLLTPEKYYKLLRVAQKIRMVLFHFIFQLPFNGSNARSRKNFMTDVLDEQSNRIIPYSGNHPFAKLVGVPPNSPLLMSVESLMYVLTIQYIRKYPGHIATSLFHFYCLILGLSNRLLVQQKHQNGFDEFQKLTLNRLRDETEKEYFSRFLQMHGNDMNYINFLEGRFSPKENERDNLDLLVAIEKGWDKLKIEIANYLKVNSKQWKEEQAPQLALIAHFIKKRESTPYHNIRHNELRLNVWKRARVLALIRKNYPRYRKRIVGIDAAASEFDAPPEVFAPAFRLLRRKGFKHCTYHAGEDFYHIVSGLRAIYEAMEFCELKASDRIGHASATGISAKQWSDLIGNKILISKGEWLDNLLFVYHLILELKLDDLKKMLPILASEIQNIGHEIYLEHYPIKLLIDSWLLRKHCPIIWLNDSSLANLRSKIVYDEHEWRIISREKEKHKDSTPIIELYHSPSCRARYEELIEINPIDLINVAEMEKLQLAVLRIMHNREIVIETLPTSNVRIGIHKDYATYQLWNWIKWEKEGHPIPSVVIGTDDTGIFATNIYNEYANVYCHLITSDKLSHSNALDVVKKLHENAKNYKFD